MTPAAQLPEAAPAPAEEVVSPAQLAAHRARVRHPRRVLAASLALGLLAELWFDGPALGLGFPLFVALALGAGVALGGREGWQAARATRWLLVPILTFAAFVAVRDSTSLTAFNVLAVLGLSTLLVAHWPGTPRLASLTVAQLPLQAFEVVVLGLVKSLQVAAQAAERAPGSPALKRVLVPAVRALAFTLPLVALFAALLSSADGIFAQLVSLEWLPQDLLSSAAARSLVVLGVAFPLAGAYAHALRRPARGESAPTVPAQATLLGPAEGLSALGALVALFTLFAWVQLKVLLFKDAAMLPAELTWADYAHEGYFQLLFTAGLVLALLMLLPRLVRLPSPLHARAFKLLSTTLVALTVGVLASALTRLSLYEEAYGLTELRLWCDVFAFCLAGVLVWRAVTLWALTDRFALGALAGCVAFVLSLDVLNPDDLIARRNLARDRATVGLDEPYLASLSADASPAIFEAAARGELSDDTVKEHLQAHQRGAKRDGFASLNLARARRWALAAECTGGP